MTFIDWSDSEGMFGLLVEFVADECQECVGDADRRDFLIGLLRELRIVEARLPAIQADQTIAALKNVVDGIIREFAADPVVVHVEECIEELERLRDDGTRSQNSA